MSTSIKLLITFAVALVLIGLVQTIGSGGRVDLTEHDLYTLSDGTDELIQGLSRPVTVKLFFSQDGTQEIVPLRNYQKRVSELLTEMQAIAPEKLQFEQIDPLPFSEAEDQAAAYGLDAAPVAPGQSIYFGLVAVPAENANAEKGEEVELSEDQSAEIIAFLQPDREAFLEYDVAQLIHKVGNPKKPVLGLMTGLEVGGGFDLMSRQRNQPWLTVQQMESLYDVRRIQETDTALPENLDVLVMIQPKVPNDELLYAIDQFALKGGRVLAFMDPVANSDQQNPMTGAEPVAAADWNRLFHGWGVALNPQQVIGDMNLALMVNQGQGQQPMRHVAIQNYPEQNIARTPFTSQISQINMATPGEWLAWGPDAGGEFEESANDATVTETADDAAAESETTAQNETETETETDAEKEAALDNELVANEADSAIAQAEPPSEVLSATELKHYQAIATEIQPLISTSENSGLLDAALFGAGTDVMELNNAFQSDGKQRSVGILLSGTGVSAFPEGPPEPAEDGPTSDAQDHLVSGEINAVLIADTDLLTDYLWVQVMGQFRGQSIAQPFADNGDFFLNALEHMSGNKALMDIRSRGTYSRPFTTVEDLRIAAEQRFREQEQQLNQQLEETERKLAELQPADQETLELTQEQQQALLDFQQERLTIRKSLRNVNLQLNQDIRDLGLKIKALNIFLVPALLFIFAVVFFTLRQKHMERAKMLHVAAG